MSAHAYLLDNNIVSYFFNADLQADLARIAGALTLAIVREVHEEAPRHATKGAVYEKWLPSSGVTVRDIAVGSPGSGILADLQLSTGSLSDLGEFASIAIASEDPSLIFVTNDKAALWIALRELYAPGERVIRFPTFLRRAHDAVGLSQAAVTKLAKHAQVSDAPPTWWSAWLTTLP
jgi:hypothetical protein